MIYLQEIGTAQTFKVIPRSYIADSMVITNEYSNESTTYAITPTIESYYLVVEKIIALKEDNSYTIKILDGTDIIFYGKIYCTNQNITNYSINLDTYVQHTSNNEFVIIND